MESLLSSIQREIESSAASKPAGEMALLCREKLRAIAEKLCEAAGEKIAPDATLIEILDRDCVVRAVADEDVMASLHFIRKLGINAQHGLRIADKKAKLARDSLLFFIDYLRARTAAAPAGAPSAKPSPSQPAKPTPVPSGAPREISEAQTRRIYIDLYLQEAGWDVLEKEGEIVPGKACIEIPVQGMPNSQGEGFCDYVLFGEDGKPLAVVEAKRTMKDPAVGSQQAKLYADCLERQYGVRPVIYYSNGYRTHCVDGVYPDRTVLAFHTRDELARMIRRRSRGSIADRVPKKSIVDRPYQIMAVTNLCERFDDHLRRGALLVLSTGTGKTRVAISIVELLARNGWIKNVLFLADRTALVKQARNNFAKLLPEYDLCVLSDHGENTNARIVLSTYPTIMNRIDSEEKLFGSGRFDLVVVDEAHRSIFNKYGAIFRYFDALFLGLTATPKEDVDRNTYDVFGCDSGVPTFDYPLRKAVEEKYLVPYKVTNRSTILLDEGVPYDELSVDEQALVDALYEDGPPPAVIPPGKLFHLVYNEDTCDKVLQDLMENGQRVNGGETLGKSIVFAFDHKHAEMIVARFRALYPELGDGYCKLIDNTINYAQSLVEEFEEQPEPRIAVSVDMLDTGVDVPAVLNLVFFKPVRSRVKFVQMIGRGTRLCPHVFGPGGEDGENDKKYFRIFDYCGNFAYFNEHPAAAEPPAQRSLTQKLYEARLDLLCELQGVAHQTDPYLHAYHGELKTLLRADLETVKSHSARIRVRDEMQHVDAFNRDSAWSYVSPAAKVRLVRHVVPLLDSDESEPAVTKGFDLKMLRIECAELAEHPGKELELRRDRDVRAVKQACQKLLQKASIPEILAQESLLRELLGDRFWETASTQRLETARRDLRGLMKYLVSEDVASIVIDHADEVLSVGPIAGGAFDIRTYREKVIDYLAEHEDLPVLGKIRSLEPIDADDLRQLEDILWNQVGTKDEYERTSPQPNVAAFVRSLVGLSQEAVNEKFGAFLTGNVLNARQQEFLLTVIEYTRQNGDITARDMMETEPFDEIAKNELFGEHIGILKNVIQTLHDCIETAA